jgi:uncharacterized protein YqeY
MSLREQIAAGLKDAMKTKQAARLSTLRLVTAALKDRDIALRTEGEERDLTDADIIALLVKMVKQRHDSARAYEEGGRLELADKERAEITVIEEFLPRQMSADEMRKAVAAEVDALGATSIRDMGKVMAALKTRYAGQMDFSTVGAMVRETLSAG